MIDVNNESGMEVDELALVALSRYALDQLRIHPQADLSIVLVDEETMTDYHVRFMDLPGPTDVMSFPMDELPPGTPEAPVEQGVLGDIVISPAVAREQAEAAGHGLEDELALLTVHGVLHLLGHDHAEAQERREMFTLQKTLLEDFLGRPGPAPTEE